MKTKLHRMGYRLSKGCDFYWKRRQVKARPEFKATVQVKLLSNGFFHVTAIEGGNLETSEYLRGVRQLKQWERFAFCL